ncbi:MAG: M14 family zinc carboxypeptidase [Myxococcota bacterium]
MGFRWNPLVVAAALAVFPAMAQASDSHYGDALLYIDASTDTLHDMGLDVWTHRSTQRGAMVRVTPQQMATLDATGWSYTIVDPDLGTRLDAEATRLAGGPGPLPGGLPANYHDDYRDFDTTLDRIAAIAAAESERTTIVEVGTSLEGRPIRGLSITNPGPADRPVILVQGTQHAREWISTAASIYAAEQYASASSGGYLDNQLDQVVLVVVPVVNPDGYTFSWEDERLWRKNRRDGIGVDLNRNWGVAWGGDGASDEPEAPNYHGPNAFSEPETVAMRDFINADPNMIALLDVHSFGQLLLYPWGYGFDNPPADALYVDLAQDMSDAMFQVDSTWYQPIQSSELYPAAGNVIDWTYGVHGLHSITIELRPGPGEEPGFLLGPEDIVPTGDELVAAIAQVIDSSLVLGPGTPGDSDGGDGPGPGDDDGTTGDPGGDETTSTSGEPGDSTGGGQGATTSGGGEESGTEPPPTPPAGTAGSDDDSGSSGGDEAGVGTDPGGCGCTTSGRDSGLGWGLLLLAVGSLRRRRRA